MSGKENRAARRLAYRDMLGPRRAVYRTSDAALRVLRYGGTWRDRAFDILVTDGMCERPMNLGVEIARGQLTDDESREVRRRELIWYVRATQPIHISWMTWIARYPFIDETWLGHGHTLQWGRPLFERSTLRHFFFLNPIITRHMGLEDRIAIDGDTVRFLWVVPITKRELEFKSREGVSAFLQVLDEVKHPFILHERRKGYV